MLVEKLKNMQYEISKKYDIFMKILKELIVSATNINEINIFIDDFLKLYIKEGGQ